MKTLKNVTLNTELNFTDNNNLTYFNEYFRSRYGEIDKLQAVTDNIKKCIDFKKERTVTGKSFFAGILYQHYGHFLLESLSRLSNYNNEETIVWVSYGLEFKGYHKEVFDILGISNCNHIIIDSKTTFESIYVPEREYIIWDKFTQKHYQWVAKLNEINPKYKGKKIWISRNGFESYQNEYIIETILINHGWFIVDPTELSIVEQASIFSSADKIAGVEGTAFHNMIFNSFVIEDIIIFSRRESKKFNGNFEIIKNTINPSHKLFSPIIDANGNVDSIFIFEHLNVELTGSDCRNISNLEKANKNITVPYSNNLITDYIRDLGLKLIKRDPILSLSLLEIAFSRRPGGLIKNRIDSIRLKLKLKS